MSDSFPGNLKYTKDHEWVKESKSGEFLVGVSSYAVEQLGDIIHVELPELGASFEENDSFGTIESTKTVSDLYMPVAGTIIEINDSLENSPEALQEDPYENGWVIKVKASSRLDNEIMTSTQYKKFIEEQ